MTLPEPATAPPTLGPDAAVQAWLVEVVTHVGPLASALAAGPAAALVRPAAVEGVVRPSASMTASERVAVYHGMYLLRMEEALAADYPALAARLGHARFGELVAAYVSTHPSRSYTLNRLGDRLPGFMAERARRTSDHALAALAKVEHAITLSFDALGARGLSADALAHASSAAWDTLSLAPQPGLRLVETDFDPTETLDDLHAGRHPRLPRRRTARTVIFRHGDEVRRTTLGRVPFRVLSALAAGETLGAALAMVPPRQAAEIAGWFEGWVLAGLFSELSLTNPG